MLSCSHDSRASASHGDLQTDLVVLLFEAMHLLLQGLVAAVPKACSSRT